MNPIEPPAEQPRNVWPDMDPDLSFAPTRPNLTPPGALPEQEAIWPARHEQPERPERVTGRPRWLTTGRVRQIIFFLLSVTETLLVIRFFLKLLGANPDATFTIFIYSVTELFVAPFEGVFPSPQTRASVLDFATLLAMIIYALLVWLIVGAMEALSNRRSSRIL